MAKSVHTDEYRLLREELISARKAAGLSQQEVATQLKRPQSYVAKVEGGERRLDVIEFLELVELLAADPHAIIRSLRRRGR
jgi:transcriptional regulator with XRE-family HTH domain